MKFSRLGLVVLALWSCGGENADGSAAAKMPDQSTCEWELFGSLLAVDTTSLLRGESDIQGLTTEGGSAVLYRDSAAASPRAVVLTLYGETGQATYRFFLESPTTFVADVEQLSYENPITGANPSPSLQSVYRDVYYVCEGLLMTGARDDSPTPTDLVKLTGRVLEGQ
jgi:hypothetical protein